MPELQEGMRSSAEEQLEGGHLRLLLLKCDRNHDYTIYTKDYLRRQKYFKIGKKLLHYRNFKKLNK